MKYFRVCISILFLTSTSLACAKELSINQERFVPGDNLVVTLAENWSGEADVYIAVSLPADDTLFFFTPPDFVLDLVPYIEVASASGSREIFQMVFPEAGLPFGEYTFYAAAMQSGSFFDMVLDVTSTSFIFAADVPIEDITFGDIRLPDGVIGRTYSFAIEPKTGTPPYQFSLISGTLPEGLTLGSDSGLIQGEPTERGMAQFTVQVVDANGNVGEIEAAIKVFGVLSFGEDGTYKGCNGLQMAFNSVQDLDEIRIEQGTYECNGLSIPSSKSFKHGIKISGGWDSGFENQSDDPAITVFDGKEEGRILDVSADGSVAIEGLSFQNGKVSGDGNDGGAINGNEKVSITNCIFTNNSASHYGGAVYNVSFIINSTFTNNSASNNGGAVYNAIFITHSTFINNTTSGDGGAIYRAGTITNSTITNNRASGEGGAVSFSGTITNSTFTNNSASDNGGAVSFSNTITNSTFTNNTASGDGGAVSFSYTITNSTFINNTASTGGAVFGSNTIINSIFTNNSAENGGAINGGGTIVNCTFANNSASSSGGAFRGSGTILNTIFAQNKVGEEANDIASSGGLHLDYTLANDVSGAVDLGTHIIMGEPRFVDADNGDFRLRADSPAVDVGDSSVIESYSFLKDDAENEIDLDGNLRIVGGAIDLGAYELQ
jgi:predicted outer membrane repeat protein